MSQKQPIRVLCVDDHPIVLTGLAAMIGGEPDMSVVASAQTADHGIALFRQHKPDIGLVDLHLPGTSGISAIRTICTEHAQARVVALTTFSTEGYVRGAVDAGARGYLLKESLLTDLIHAIRIVHGGGRWIPQSIATVLAESTFHERLTPREQEVLSHIVNGQRNSAINEELGISGETVKVHVRNIFAKLQVEDRAQAIVTALRRGLTPLNH